MTVSIYKQFGKYVSLNILSMLGLSCYIFADTLFVANGLGNNGLTALNLALPIFSFMNGIGLMIGMGSATQFAAYKGSGEVERANKVFTNAFILDILFSSVMIIIAILFSDQIAYMLGADDEILPMVSIYLKVILLFSPLFMINNLLVFFIRNDDRPKLAMIAMLSSTMTNIVLDYIFIFPLQMGMLGAVLATGISPFVSICILSVHFFKRKNSFKLISPTFNLKHYAKILAIGVTSFITEFSSGIVMLIFNLSILEIAGKIGVAAYGVIANVAIIAISIFTGAAQGTQPLVSANYGKGDIINIQKLCKAGIILTLVLGALMYIVGVVFNSSIVSAFNSENNPRLQQIAESGIVIYFLSFFFSGVNIFISTFFASIQQPKPSFVISIIRGGLIIVPLIFILPNLFAMTGVWLVVPITELCTIIISGILLNKARKIL